MMAKNQGKKERKRQFFLCKSVLRWIGEIFVRQEFKQWKRHKTER